MERFARHFFSIKMMIFGMIVFFVAIAAATFIESSYDTQTARLYIYSATWFNVLLAYLGFNLLSNMFTYNLFRPEKFHSLLFHVAFLVMLIGSAVTRFVGYEGTMMIREGATADFLYSADPYLSIRINDGTQQLTHDERLYLSEWDTWNGFGFMRGGWNFQFPKESDNITLEYVDFRKNLVDSIVTHNSIRETSLEFVRNGQPFILSEGDVGIWDQLPVSYESEQSMPGLELYRKKNKVLMKVTGQGTLLPMSALRTSDRENPNIPDSLYQVLPNDTLIALEKMTLYNINGAQFVFRDLKRNTKRMLIRGDKDEGRDFLTVKVASGKDEKIVELPGGWQQIGQEVVFELNGLTYEMRYGAKRMDVPFKVMCRDFRMETYPSSNSPSSFESDLTIIDDRKNFKKDYLLFMNHVVDYDGYRFFQSSYDKDLKGTILSVNHDFWGTMLSYIGYLVMGLGMVLSLFVKNSRFMELIRKLNVSRQKMREELNALMIVFLVGSTAVFAQDADMVDTVHQHEHHDHHNHNQTRAQPPTPADPTFYIMSEEHSEELASLLVADNSRFLPVHTHCDQLLRKIYRGVEFGHNGKTYNPVQAVLSFMIYSHYWAEQPTIYVSSKGGLRERLGVKGSHISFIDLTDPTRTQFVLQEEYLEAHRKKESARSEFDKELLRLHDRFELAFEMMTWWRFKIVPLAKSPTSAWAFPYEQPTDPADTSSFRLVNQYLDELKAAPKSKNFKKADAYLTALKKLQRDRVGDVLPSESAVQMEITYNKQPIFQTSAMYYALFGFVLLLVFFLQVLSKPTQTTEVRYKIVRRILEVGVLLVFLYHTYGLFLRTVVTEEVPWKNGYEAMVFICWVVMVTGFILARKHPVILAGAAILAALLLQVNEMSAMDPEITPLVPVLKSYWLRIHVAIITGSYAPLGLACILALINMGLYIARGASNGIRLTRHITQITYIVEILMTIGVFMLTIGTFLGGVWANESWGRYWGWDAKETWALIAIIVYAIILHFRYIPGLRGKLAMNLAGFWAFSSILFTFFGVNFILVGLHSYAQGEGFVGFPSWLTYTIIALVILTGLVIIRNRQYMRLKQDE